MINGILLEELANELSDDQQNEEIMILPNEAVPMGIDLKSDWVVIAPYGSWKHSRGMQIFEREDAERMAQSFQSLANVATRLVGLPWYIGHPDHPEFRDRYPDGKAYGRIKDLRAGDKGLEGKVKWSTQGKEMVNEGMFHGHSPNWLGVWSTGNRWRPVELKSVGFTNEPNIPVPPITRANEKRADNNNEDNKPKKMDERIKQELLAAGIIQPGATDDDVRSGVQALCNESKDLRSKVTGLESKVSAAETALANEKKAREEADTAKTTALTALANERKERATLVVDAAVTRGAVPTGERDAKIESLANEADEEKFSTALTALANESGTAMKTGSKVGNLGARDRSGKSGDLSIREQTEALANEIAKGGQVTDRIYEQAYARLKTQKPELFETAAKK